MTVENIIEIITITMGDMFASVVQIYERIVKVSISIQRSIQSIYRVYMTGAYKISQYSYGQAKRLGVEIVPSATDGKKIDVYKGDELVASIGDTRYHDYPYYMYEERMGKYKRGTANRNRYLYHKRHAKDASVPDSPGFYAAGILW